MKHKGVDISEISNFGIDEDIAKEFIDMREGMGKRFKLTQGGFNRMLKQAMKCELNLGIRADEAITIAIDKSWQGVTYEYIKAELSRRRQADQASSRSGRDVAAETRGATRNDWSH
jgi:hypothetical protein